MGEHDRETLTSRERLLQLMQYLRLSSAGIWLGSAGIWRQVIHLILFIVHRLINYLSWNRAVPNIESNPPKTKRKKLNRALKRGLKTRRIWLAGQGFSKSWIYTSHSTSMPISNNSLPQGHKPELRQRQKWPNKQAPRVKEKRSLRRRVEWARTW